LIVIKKNQMTPTQKADNTVTIFQEEYDALVQSVQVTSEYLQGKSEKFHSAEDLIKNLKNP